MYLLIIWSDIGGALGISQIILGVTAAAIGTSLPEFGSAMIASLSGSVDIGVGTVIGSNIWNIAGILGISAIAAGIIRTDSSGINRDGLMTLVTGIILIFFMLFGDINWTASVVMIALYIFYLWRLIKSQKEYKEPELVVTLSSAMKGLHELSIGTILGSNTFNILIGIGIPALFIDIPVEKLSLTFDAPVMIFVTVLLLLLVKRSGKLTRNGGIILLATYISYAAIRLTVLV